MDDLGPDAASDGLLQGPSGELETGAIRVHHAAVRVGHPEKLGKEVDDRTELALVLPDALLRPLSVVDVRQQDVPAGNRAVGTTQRARACVKPAMDTVGSAYAVVGLVRLPGFDRRPPRRNHATTVIRMNRVASSPGLQLFGSLSKVVESPLVDELDFTVRCVHGHLSVDAVNDEAELLFALTQRVFGQLMFSDVSDRSHELVAFECVRYSSSECVNVLDSPVRQQQSIGMLEV